ncbi:MAG: hypothetical protein KC933_33815, partial [Myxococcales bacterium]|nr:hypothetical protein [Myxococcales bacterium]
MRERTHAVGLSLFMLVAAVPAHADEGEPPAVAATRTSTASPWRRTVFLSTGLLLMDTAYTRPVEGVGGELGVPVAPAQDEDILRTDGAAAPPGRVVGEERPLGGEQQAVQALAELPGEGLVQAPPGQRLALARLGRRRLVAPEDDGGLLLAEGVHQAQRRPPAAHG